ncbi:glycosyltransferase family 4 protein [Labilibaculum antarcticum]|uniref:Group 1 glycosyl transferase n=1 Tax=Labilibaculum antarcticum TaxID=1717717 RepID=A0A1Y1CJJ4_9BACT|nr:glycosyltransferase family 1 protein [Labilibaculum antarcticum]BAX80470.1 group 1 glycosyl transferase [Labilibaculum antarcticum]
MKIGIEGQRLYRKKKHGMDMVALELIKNLQLIDKENEYVIFVKPDEDNTCIPKADNFKIIELGGGPYPIWEQFALPKAAKAEGCDILHCTSNTGPLRSEVPLVTILHDIIYLESVSIFKKGGTWYQKIGNMYRRWVVPPVARKSKRVSTVSNFEKDRIKNFMGLGDNLVAIHNGVGEHFTPVNKKEILDEAKLRYKLPDNFMFFLGNTDPKKNTPNVLKAFAEFNATSPIKYKLVMLDYEENALRKILSDIGYPELRNDIHLTGYVVNTDLPAIISQCKVFLYPSLRESFGIPILEGMACGVPVITSNTSSMPEIAGDAALIVDPYKSEEIKLAISKILNDDAYRTELCKKGIERAKLFSWKNMAVEYLKLYKEVYAEINEPVKS